MAKKINKINQGNAKQAGIQKFRRYSEPRNIYMKESTYGLRTVVHGSKKTQLEAVDAVDPSGQQGWVVNLANRQRKFVSQKDGYIVI